MQSLGGKQETAQLEGDHVYAVQKQHYEHFGLPNSAFAVACGMIRKVYLVVIQ